MTDNLMVFITILCSAAVTYSLRLGGLLLSEKLPSSGKFKIFMDALPGTLLLSLIAPGIASSGLWGGIAAICTAVCTYRTGNVFLAMITGVGIVALSRYFC
ncbi:MAG: AzlD domain-containing protein [Desulfobacteraceae bacterium]|nr:AzlD domain-containing protein [Desulfobacteraceae bacterium]